MVQLPAGLKVPRSPSSPAGAYLRLEHLPAVAAAPGTRAKDTMSDLPFEPRTGQQHDIAAGDYQATVTELGAGLRRLSYRGQPVISAYAADDVPPAGSGELLIPWPNRVDHGRYPFGGSTHQLDLSEPANANAIHGLIQAGREDGVRGAFSVHFKTVFGRLQSQETILGRSGEQA